MEKPLSDLLKQREEGETTLAHVQFFEEYIHGKRYKLTELGQRKESREMFRETIPRIGEVLYLHSIYDDFDESVSEDRECHPELVQTGALAYFDWVADAEFTSKVNVELTIKRYFITESIEDF